jgi:hypothetical protein
MSVCFQRVTDEVNMSVVKTYPSVSDPVCRPTQLLSVLLRSVQPCFGKNEVLGGANLHFRPAAAVEMQIAAKDFDRLETRFIKAALIME